MFCHTDDSDKGEAIPWVLNYEERSRPVFYHEQCLTSYICPVCGLKLLNGDTLTYGRMNYATFNVDSWMHQRCTESAKHSPELRSVVIE